MKEALANEFVTLLENSIEIKGETGKSIKTGSCQKIRPQTG